MHIVTYTIMCAVNSQTAAHRHTNVLSVLSVLCVLSVLSVFGVVWVLGVLSVIRYIV